MTLSTDQTTPTVAVDVWYHVGSKNESPGRTGFAHLFEHVMFTGSGHAAYGIHDKLTNGVGGSNNGTTDNDRTTYYETIPPNYLESAVWLEADRMGFLLDTLDLAKLNAQRDIVKNERRQGVDNQPYGRAGEILSHATYPASHPYSWDVIGSMEDLSAASLFARQSSNEDVGEFLMAITPRPGHSLTDLEAAADAVIDKFKDEGPTQDEIQKATAGLELGYVSGLQSNLGKAFRLADGAGFHGTPGYFQTEYQKSLAVTPADVKRVANKFLTRGRVVLSIVPIGKADQASKP